MLTAASPLAAPEPSPSSPWGSTPARGDDRTRSTSGAPASASRPSAGLPMAEHPDAVILVVDDQPANIAILVRMLNRAGYSHVVTTTDSRETVGLVERHRPHLLLLDWHMPHMDGMDVLEAIAPQLSAGVDLPVVILSAEAAPEAKAMALARGAKDFVMKPFDAAEVLLRTRNLLETRRLQTELRRQNQDLEERLRARTAALEEAHAGTLERLARAVEFRDDATGQHTQRVGNLSAKIATALGLSEDRVRLLRRAAPLHDVGKIGIPDAILYKPGPLTPEEFAVMSTHTTIGANLLADARSSITELAERIARSHHERWDGSGYPDRLAGEAIPIEARVVAVADFYDALTSDRPYRLAWTAERTLDAIVAASGTHFDPEVVDAFLRTGIGQDDPQEANAA
jgi:putative two-component system response regulator